MAKNISLLGADYPDVPAVVLPKTGGGSAMFVDADDVNNVENALAIVVNGNTAPKAITAGQYLFIKNHSTLATGGYHATANISSGGAVSGSNVAADADGISNAINDKFTPVNLNGSNVGTVQNNAVLDTNTNYTYTRRKAGWAFVHIRITCPTITSADGSKDILQLADALIPSSTLGFLKAFDMWGTTINGTITISSTGMVSAFDNCSGKDILIMTSYPLK